MSTKFMRKNKMLTIVVIVFTIFIHGCAVNGLKKSCYPNGLTTVLMNDKNSSSSSVVVFVNVGSNHEKPSQSGISHLIEHLMFKGSKNYIGNSMRSRIESMGGSLGAFTYPTYTMYYVNIQKEGVEEAVKMLADAMENPLFEQEEIDREKKVVIEEIKMRSDNPQVVLYEEFNKIIYKETPRINDVAGTTKTIAAMPREEMLGYYKANYTPKRICVVVSGNFDETRVKKLLKETFGKLEKQSLLLSERIQIGKNVVEYKNLEVGYMVVGFAEFNPDTKDSGAFSLARDILSDRLHKIVEIEKHLASSVYSCGSRGSFYVYCMFEPKNLELIKSEIRKQIEDIIKNGATEQELNRMKLMKIRKKYNSIQTPYDIANYCWLSGDPKYIAKKIKKIERFTLDDINNIFRKYYSLERLSSLIFLPKAKGVKDDK